MSKIFRLYTEGASTFTDWNESPTFPYNSNNRDNIDDPDGASARNEITSIPSPFARIDLVKNAFKIVTSPHPKTHETDLDGKTIFHKMVSDALDVGEIFFNIQSRIRFIPVTIKTGGLTNTILDIVILVIDIILIVVIFTTKSIGVVPPNL